MPSPNQEKWKRNAERYLEFWNLPHCTVATDGTLIREKCFPIFGSLYFNYQGYCSVVLLAHADADALFAAVRVGYFGKKSDASMFTASTLGNAGPEELHILCPASIPKDEAGEMFPYYFVADEAFSLKVNIMGLYPRRILTNKIRMFNYRLIRARKIVECAFGIFIDKFKIFERPICCKEATAISIVKASVVLRSFIRIGEGVFSEVGESFAVNQPAFPTEHEEGEGRHRLPRAHL
jgi:hypothetical protein